MSYRPLFTPQQWIDELNSEIAMRWKVYPNLVRQGRMTESASDRKIGTLTDLRDALVERQRQKVAAAKADEPNLFPNPTSSQ